MRAKSVQFILRHRVAVLAVLLAVTAVAGYFAARVAFDNTIEIWFLEGDEGLAGYRRFLDLFESDELVVVAMAPGDVFTTQNLALVDRIARRLRGIDNVIRVTSLTDVEVPRAVDGGVEIGPLMDGIPSDPAELEDIRRRALSNPLLSGTLLSPKGDATAIVAQIAHIQGQFDYKVALLKQVREILSEEASGGPALHLGGAPVIDDAFFRYTERDFDTFMPVAFLLVTIVIFVIFRRPSSVMLPLSVVLLSEVWTFGLMGLLGLKINVVSTILAPLLLAVGIADSIHLLSEYFDELGAGRSRQEAIVGATGNVFTPCLLTSVTTAAGLLSLLTSELGPIREFGAMAAVGVLLAFVITMVFMPVALSFLKPRPGRALATSGNGPLVRALLCLGRLGTRRPGVVIGVSVLLAVAAVAAVTRLEVGTNSMDYFRRSDPVRQDIDFIDARIGGTASIEFLLQGDEPGAFKEPAALAKMEALSAYLEDLPGVSRAYSIVDYLKEMNRVLHGGDPKYYVLPATRAEAAQYLLLMEGSDDLDDLIQDDAQIARVSARIRMEDSMALSARVDEIEAYLATHFRDGIRAQATGLVMLMHEMEAYLLQSQIRSFAVAFVVIVILMGMMLRSLTLGLFAMIPNVLPVLLTMGIMGVAGIHLDVGTVTIASIILGLVVDDSIHFLYRIREELPRCRDTAEAILVSIRSVGKPIFSTSVILALGFWVLCLASFKPNINFGLLSGTAIVLALLADLIVLPAAIILLKPRFRFREAPAPAEDLGRGDRRQTTT